MEIWMYGNMEIQKYEKYGNTENWNGEIGKYGNTKIWKYGKNSHMEENDMFMQWLMMGISVGFGWFLRYGLFFLT